MSTEDVPKGLRRQPKAVTKPRVGNPWRESIQGDVNAPTMRVRGGAPSGMPVPSWQGDGAPVAPREAEGPDTATEELQSVRRAFNVASPTMPPLGAEIRPHVPTVFDARPVGRANGVTPQHDPSTAGVCAVSTVVAPPSVVSTVFARVRLVTSIVEERAIARAELALLDYRRAVASLYDRAPGRAGVSEDTRAELSTLRSYADHCHAVIAHVRAVCADARELARVVFPDTVLPVPYRAPSVVFDGGDGETARPRAGVRWEGPTRREAVSWDIACDPSHQTRTILDTIAPRVVQRAPSPVSPAQAAVIGPVLSTLAELMPRTVKGAARKGVEGGMVRPDVVRNGRTYGDTAAAVRPCQWCDSVACDHARREDLRCGVYEWAGGDRGPKRPKVQPCAEWSAYVVARDAYKAPRKAHAACLQWIEDGRQRTIDALRALDARGVSIELDSPRGAMHDGTVKGHDIARATFKGGVWRSPTTYTYRCGKVHTGRDLAYGREHRGYLYSRVDAAHFALARWTALGELLASAGRGKVEDARAVLSSVSDAAPKGVWWRDALVSWRDTHDTHSGAVGALVGVCRARRDTTVARAEASRYQDTARRVLPSVDSGDARHATVVTAPRKAPTAPARAPMAREPGFTALRPSRARVVAPTGVQSIAPRIAGDAPAYPVAPRVRKGDDASQCTPERAPAVWRDAPIEELATRVTRR